MKRNEIRFKYVKSIVIINNEIFCIFQMMLKMRRSKILIYDGSNLVEIGYEV